jgi:hypothetical protein
MTRLLVPLAFGVVAFMLIAATVPEPPQGCIMTSSRPVDVMVFEDTSINDEGDLVASLRLGPDRPGRWVNPVGQFVRLKIRTGKDHGVGLRIAQADGRLVE